MGFCTRSAGTFRRNNYADWHRKNFSLVSQMVYVSNGIGALPRGANASGVPLNVWRYAVEMRAIYEFSAARTRAHISRCLGPEPGAFCHGAESCRRPHSKR